VYARVTAGGEVTANSQGIAQANLVKAAKGIYCFVGLASAPKGGVVTIDSNVPGPGSGSDLAQVGLGRLVTRRLDTCPEGTQAYVATFTPATELVDDPFFVLFWN